MLDEILNRQFNELIKSFKPKFGHPQHIRIVESIEKLNLKLKPKEVESVKSKIIYLIKTYGITNEKADGR